MRLAEENAWLRLQLEHEREEKARLLALLELALGAPAVPAATPVLAAPPEALPSPAPVRAGSSSAERMRRMRAKQREGAASSPVTANVTVTPGDASQPVTVRPEVTDCDVTPPPPPTPPSPETSTTSTASSARGRAREGGEGASQPASQGLSVTPAIAFFAKLLERRRMVFPQAWDTNPPHDWDAIYAKALSEAGGREEPILAGWEEYLQSDWARERQPVAPVEAFFKGRQDWRKFVPGQGQGAARRALAEARPPKVSSAPRANDGVPLRELRPCSMNGCEGTAQSELEGRWLCYPCVAELVGVQPRRVGT